MIIEVDFRALGLLISKYRHNADLSQEKLAEKIGVSTNFLGNIERGEKHPSVDTLFKICVALDLPPNELLNSSVAQPVGKNEKHILRDSSPDYINTLTDILLKEKAENASPDREDGPAPRFGYLDIGDEYNFTWRD